MLKAAAGRRFLDLDHAQARTAAVGLVGALVVFLTTERLCAPTYDLSIPLDARIPFVPASWWVYVLFHPYVIASAASASPARFDVAKKAALLAFVVAALGVAVCLSTLTVKQHTCADVAGGAVLALLAVVATRRLVWQHAR